MVLTARDILREKIIAFDEWYAQFYLTKDFVRVPQNAERMLMYAMKRKGRLIAYMDLEDTSEGRIVYVYPTQSTLAAAVRRNGEDEYTIYAENGLQVFGGVRW